MVPIHAEPVLGIDVPDTRTIFLAVLAVHVLAGMTAVVAGATAALVGKRPGRHPWAGRVYLPALGIVFVTALLMAILRWPHNTHLLVLGALAFGLGLGGLAVRRRGAPGWAPWHLSGMGGSYIVLLTGFYVDNGRQLPVWKLLPSWAYWVVPAAVGLPIIVRAIRKYRDMPAVRMKDTVAS